MWWMLLQIFEIDKRSGHKKEIRLTYTDVVSSIWITGKRTTLFLSCSWTETKQLHILCKGVV